MKTLIKITVTILVLFTVNSATACICAKLGEDFFDTVNQHNNKIKTGEWPASDALTIVTGSVMQYKEVPKHIIPPSMQVKVSQVIQGKVTEKLIWVDGDTDGFQCRPPVIKYKLNSTYIFAIQQDQKKNFYISGCGYYSQETIAPERDGNGGNRSRLHRR